MFNIYSYFQITTNQNSMSVSDMQAYLQTSFIDYCDPERNVNQPESTMSWPNDNTTQGASVPAPSPPKLGGPTPGAPPPPVGPSTSRQAMGPGGMTHEASGPAPTPSKPGGQTQGPPPPGMDPSTSRKPIGPGAPNPKVNVSAGKCPKNETKKKVNSKIVVWSPNRTDSIR